MTTCLVLGGAACLHADLEAYNGPVDGVVACNDAGAEWPGKLDAWVTLHPRNMTTSGWLEKRAARGYPAAQRLFCHPAAIRGERGNKPDMPEGLEASDYEFPGQHGSGSSGLFAAKVALLDLGFHRVVLCGVPMTPAPHFWDKKAINWQSATSYRKVWLTVPEKFRNRMRSMSGWTRVLLGAPETQGEG